MPESPSTSNSSHKSRRLDELPREERRRLLLRTAIRIGAVQVALFTAYAVAPLTYRNDGEHVIRVLGTVCVLTGVIALQFRAMQVARFPALRAIEGFALIVPSLLLGFAATYVRLSTANPDAFNQPLDRVGAVYFSLTIMATVGFGDIAATTNGARISVMMQMTADVIVLGVVARLMVNGVKLHTGRSRDEYGDRDADAGR
jgi:hypothetical protein